MSSSRYRWVVLAAATVMQVGISMPQQAPAALGPVLVHALGLSGVELGLLTSAIWGGMVLGMLPFGYLIDRFGERWVVVSGSLLLTAFLLLASRAGSFLPLFLLLVPAAVGAASGAPGGARAIASWFPPRIRGMALGVRQGGVTVAGVLVALILPPIALRWGWPAALLTVAALAMAATVAFAALYREPPAQPSRGHFEFSLTALFGDRTFLAATLFGWMFMGVLGADVTYLPTSLHQRAGVSPVAAGFFLALFQLGGLAGRIGWGLLSDRVASRTLPMGLVGLLSAVACLLMALLGREGVPALVIAAVCVLLGVTGMGWNALYVTLAAESVPVHHAATAVAAGTTVNLTGMILIAPLFGLLADRTGSYLWAWLALAVWTLLAGLPVLMVRDRPHEPP
jgi:sugar phosphate permease